MYGFCNNAIGAVNGTAVFAFTNGTVLSAVKGTTQLSTHTGFPSCGVATYFRSGLGGAPLPWIFAIILFVTNICNVVVRVRHFAAAQTFSMVLSFTTAFVVTLAYISTHREPESIMVWTPVLLVGNGGSLLQVLVFIVEEHGPRLPGVKRFVRAKDTPVQRISLRTCNYSPMKTIFVNCF